MMELSDLRTQLDNAEARTGPMMVRVVSEEGDLYEILSAKFSVDDGGQIYINVQLMG